MGFLHELAGRVEEAAVAGGRFADSLVRVAGYAVAGVITFAEKEIEYAQKAAKKEAVARTASAKGVTHR